MRNRLVDLLLCELETSFVFQALSFSSVQLAISVSNSGGSWDNAKKYVERASPDSELQGKGSDVHKAAVVGDTVEDTFKGTRNNLPESSFQVRTLSAPQQSLAIFQSPSVTLKYKNSSVSSLQ